MNLCIAKPNKHCAIETFINNHVAWLQPSEVICNGYYPYEFEDRKGSILPSLFASKYAKGALRRLLPPAFEALYRVSLARFLKSHRIEVVFAEYGPTGANIMAGCRAAGVPLVVIFHGFDASDHQTLRQYYTKYQAMFGYASCIIAVSEAMRTKLLSLGAPADKTHWNPYGVDTRKFYPAEKVPDPGTPVHFIFIGRLTPKKAPQLLLQAFHRMQQSHPGSRLSIIGSGELGPACRILATQLNLNDTVSFSEAVTPDEVPALLRKADVYVQHSVVPESGDSEGTPNSILEAAASALPVVSTRHGGIPEVVVHGESGFLVPEHDTTAMADYMGQLAADPALRQAFGRRGRKLIEEKFSLERSIGVIGELLEKAVARRGL